MKVKPEVNKIHKVASTRLFNIEEVDLTFSNGQKRIYERLSPSSHRAVMIIPMLDDDTFILVKEYSVGVEDYTLSFPKGLVEKDEDIFEAANRELMEEIGKGAEHFYSMKSLMLSPNYMTNSIFVVKATGLYNKKLEGDEPEPLDILEWKLADIDSLLSRDDFLESRSITALLMLWKSWIEK